MAKRLATVRTLSEGASSIYASLSDGGESGLRCRIQAECLQCQRICRDDGSILRKRCEGKLTERQRGQELARGMTVTGPHRDDLDAVRWMGWMRSAFASRGQTRTAVLALKLAEAAYLREAARSGAGDFTGRCAVGAGRRARRDHVIGRAVTSTTRR